MTDFVDELEARLANVAWPHHTSPASFDARDLFGPIQHRAELGSFWAALMVERPPDVLVPPSTRLRRLCRLFYVSLGLQTDSPGWSSYLLRNFVKVSRGLDADWASEILLGLHDMFTTYEVRATDVSVRFVDDLLGILFASGVVRDPNFPSADLCAQVVDARALNAAAAYLRSRLLDWAWAKFQSGGRSAPQAHE